MGQFWVSGLHTLPNCESVIETFLQSQIVKALHLHCWRLNSELSNFSQLLLIELWVSRQDMLNIKLVWLFILVINKTYIVEFHLVIVYII